jgi:UDP-N-acetylglucosamine--N-acetylmuramyl-(pentapeptide) pyrophosphoryl-undecaprenol N-acetylglucosamine transferase
VSPALAVGDALVASGCERSEVLFVGGRRGIEGKLVPAAGYRLIQLPGRGIQRSITRENVGAALGLVVASFRALGLALQQRPRVVITVGGYAGFAYALAAVVLRIPLVVVTVDAVPGAVNRLVGRFASVNAVAFPGGALPRSHVTGPPVRASVLAASRDPQSRRRVRERLGVDPHRWLVVVTGGSLGAGSVNEATLALGELWSQRDDVAIYHVAGERNLSEMTGAAAKRGLMAPVGAGAETESGPALEYRLVGFDPDLVAALAACDVVVCRAGASTVAELTAIGVPSILVPLPGSPGDHQTKNAEALERAGAGVMIRDRDLSGERLAETLQRLLDDAGALEQMSKAAAALGHRDAAERVAALARQLAGGGAARSAA